MIDCGALAGLALFTCFARNPACLPPQHRHLELYLTAIAERESGFRPNALRDETPGRACFQQRAAMLERIAAENLARGHTIGAGWFQITHQSNWRRHGLTIANVFDPCVNMRAGAAHFASDVAGAMTAALRAYNGGPRAMNGSVPAAATYATAVQARVGANASIIHPPPPRHGARFPGAVQRAETSPTTQTDRTVT